MSSLCVITARGGSKRIPRKNIRPFCGKPIIAYSIQTAQSAGCFDEVMVSTDDTEIAVVAEEYGAIVPFIRSATTANDFATTADVLLEVLGEYKKRGREFDFCCCIYPTAPFVTVETLQAGWQILSGRPDIEGVIPVVRFSFPIQRALVIDNGFVSMIQPEHLLTRSQDLLPTYHDAGQFYWIRIESFLKTRLLIGKKTIPLILPEWQVHDIDHEDDWVIAELKYQMLHHSTI